MPLSHRFSITTTSAAKAHLQCCWLQAAEAYERATQLEPDNNSLQDALQRAQIAERRQAEACQHKFRPRSEGTAIDRRSHSHSKRQPAARVGVLSFADNDNTDDES